MQFLVVNNNGRNDDEEAGVEVDEELGDAEEERKYAVGGIQDESNQGSRDGLRNDQVDDAGRADSRGLCDGRNSRSENFWEI